MDAKHWTGDDNREFGPDADDCQVCGALADQPCKPGCDCEDCEDEAQQEREDVA